MGSKGVGLAAAAGGFIGLFVGVGLGRLVSGHSGSRTSGQASMMLALSAVGASAGAYVGGSVGVTHLLPAGSVG